MIQVVVGVVVAVLIIVVVVVVSRSSIIITDNPECSTFKAPQHTKTFEIEQIIDDNP